MNFIRSGRGRFQRRALRRISTRIALSPMKWWERQKLIWRVSLLVAVSCLALPANAASLHGIVQTGGTTTKLPLANIRVTLFEATTGQSTELERTTTDTSGHFIISSSQHSTPGIFFINADIDEGVKFVAIVGPELPSTVTVNELTTVAASYSLAQFYERGLISGNSFGLRLAAGINDDIVTPATGESSPVLLSSPNADETNSLRSTRSLANLLAACVHNSGVTATFLGLTTPPRGPAPRNTSQALANLARYPGQNVQLIYLLTKLGDSYSPSLRQAPDAWTVTVKVNDSGDDRFLFGGPGNLAFDSRGYAWITNNVRQGKTTSSRVLIVLKPNGTPADGSDGTPFSPVMGGGILGVGFGITIDPSGSVWVGNFGWGGVNPSSPGHGSVSQISGSGLPISRPRGYQGGPLRAQGMAADAHGNIWIASFGNDSVYVFPNGHPKLSVGFPEYPGSQPFDIAIAADGSAWVTNSGGLLGQYPSSIAKFALVNGALQRQFLRFVGKSLKGLSLDSKGNAWFASLGDDSVYGFRPDGSEIGQFNGGGIDSPWNVTVDGNDNLWVSNFGPTKPGSNFTVGRLSELAGMNPATRPPNSGVGDPISPATGYTVPSAGSQVLLHNGDPLYGPGRPPSYAAIMRQTSSVIDRAGNVWSINNWKPDFDIDALSNPGGDGIVIFVGLAAPPPESH